MPLPCDRPQSLHLTTRRLLRADERSIPTIAAESGLPYFWLRKFNENRARSPALNRVQFLYEYLTGTKLDLN